MFSLLQIVLFQEHSFTSSYNPKIDIMIFKQIYISLFWIKLPWGYSIQNNKKILTIPMSFFGLNGDVDKLSWKINPSLETCTGKSLLEALILASTNQKYFVHWFTSSVHENNKLRTCCVHKWFFFCFVLTFRTIVLGL